MGDCIVKAQTLWATVGIVGLLVTACSPDQPLTSPDLARPVGRRALTREAALIQQAVAGVRVRGEQDDMLRREAELPGFGGFYIDSLDHMVVYMKAGSVIPQSVVRQTLVGAYSTRPEPRIQGLMPEIARARIIPGDFSLSELIASENRISHSTRRIPGYTGVGTRLTENRVVVGFLDAADVDAGLAAIQSMGISAKMIVGEVWGPIALSSSFDQADPTRPTRGGLRIEIHNTTDYPWVDQGFGWTTWIELCSLNFNARWRPAGQNTYTDYMVTTAHCANEYRGINGVTGDTVFQPRFGTLHDDPPMKNAAGFVAVNEPWNTICGTNPRDSTVVDFCLDADVMLVRPAPGVTTDRRLATSTYQGNNGDPGSMSINNWYGIGSVVTPEWISHTPYNVFKSGAVTGTTHGALDLTVTQLVGRICWPSVSNCPDATGRSGGRQIAYYNVAKVLHAGWGLGDSGGVVFADNGSPYYALGIQVGGQGHLSKFASNVWRCDAGTGCSFYFQPWWAMEQSAQHVLGNGTLNPVTAQ